MDTPPQGGGAAIGEDLHGGCVNPGQDPCEGIVVAAADGARARGRGVAVLDHAVGPDATLEPDTRAAAVPADAGLVAAPELDVGPGVGLRDALSVAARPPS